MDIKTDFKILMMNFFKTPLKWNNNIIFDELAWFVP